MQKHLEVSSSKNESSLPLCSLDRCGLVKIHSLVRGCEDFPPGSEDIDLVTLSSVCQLKGVKGESSPSAGWFVSINEPCPFFLSVCATSNDND